MFESLSKIRKSISAIFDRLGRKEIRLIQDNELKKWLSELDLLEKIKDRKLVCAYCDRVITWENLAGLVAESGEYKPFCRDHELIGMGHHEP